jgi:5-(carboxyamino)imidazole ribonucleotide mutase
LDVRSTIASFARQDENKRKVTKPHKTGEEQMQTETVPLVSIVMGSKSDLDTLKEASVVLDAFGLAHELRVISAHRTPEIARTYALSAEARGIRVIIAAAGKAAHLAGVIASMTTLPIIGVPMATSDLGGLDSLLSMVQMPGGIPVATVAIGKAGAKNAALLAIAILALSDSSLRDRLVKYRTDMAEDVEQSDQTLQAERKAHGGV